VTAAHDNLCMKNLAFGAILCVLSLCFAGCDRSKEDVLTYTRQLQPSMTVDQVKALFPKEMHWIDESADESKDFCCKPPEARIH